MTSYLFVQLDPREVTLGVCVLEAEEPHLPQADGFDDLVEQLLAGGALLYRKLQLRVHRRDAHVHLEIEGQMESLGRISLIDVIWTGVPIFDL